ncbi:MAG: efflux RND transporter periplasmic adaptor subunit [Candidatus Aminicenantes bacterium]|nr:efflux RND transporter periplasmic adaptor subunit [Candidatus Aminicenantes bacterium]
MKIGRIIIILILIALAAFVGYRANQNIQAKKKAASQPAPETIVPVEAVLPSRLEIADKVHAVGSIQSDAEVSIFSKVSGKVANNLVKMGSAVQPGQIVSVVNRDEVGYDYKPYEVKSDAKGVVARIILNPGASVNPNSPIMNLIDIDTVKVVVAVDEKKIRFIGMGQSARVALEAYPGEIFSARVTNISPIANPISRTVDVELSIPNPNHRIKPGMYVEVEWVISTRTATVVPLGAVVDRGGQKFVFLAADGLAKMKAVSVGAVVGDVIEILTGLKGDERIVTTGAGQLNDKDKIKVVASKPAQV